MSKRDGEFCSCYSLAVYSAIYAEATLEHNLGAWCYTLHYRTLRSALQALARTHITTKTILWSYRIDGPALFPADKRPILVMGNCYQKAKSTLTCAVSGQVIRFGSWYLRYGDNPVLDIEGLRGLLRYTDSLFPVTQDRLRLFRAFLAGRTKAGQQDAGLATVYQAAVSKRRISISSC